MTVELLQPIIDPLLGRRRRTMDAAREPLPVRCGHCESTEAAWPVRLATGDAPLICVRCGGYLTGEGSRLDMCDVCAHPRGLHGHPARSCPFGRGGLDQTAVSGAASDRLGEEAYAAASRLCDPSPAGSLDAYLGGVLERVGQERPARIGLIDVGEPAIAMLPGGDVIASLGLLAALEDEAQLAFVMARELALERDGWIWRRFGAAWKNQGGWLRRLSRRSDGSLVRAVDLSLNLGYGIRAEQAADRAGLAALVHADYEPGAAVRSLRLLESAALSGTGARFLLAADRADWLEQGATALGGTATSQLNREVFRRAVDGFNVFGR
jgi:hypothetical protein